MTVGAGPISAPTTLVLNPGGRRTAAPMGRTEKAFCILICGLLFLEHMVFGGGRREVALAFCSLQGLILAIVVLAAPWARGAFEAGRALVAPAALLGLVFLVAVWSLTPWVPGGPHPIWSFVAATPAAAIDKSAVLIELVRLAALACVFLTGWVIGVSDDRARYFLRALIIGAGVYAGWAFVNQLVAPGYMFGVIPMAYGGVRLTGSFYSANTAGSVFGVGVVLAVCAITDRSRDRGDPKPGLSVRLLQAIAVNLAVLAFSVACLILTASRGALAATGAAVAAFLIWEGFARRWRLIGPAGLALVTAAAGFVALLAIGGEPFFARMLSVGADPGTRRDIAHAHWSAFLAAPWLGYGLGSFDGVNAMVITSANYDSLWNIRAAHDVYLQWLEEAGALGAAPMFACIAWILTATARGSFLRVRMTTWLRGLVAASLVLLIHGASDFALQIPSVATLWACLLGLGYGVSVRLAARR